MESVCIFWFLFIYLFPCAVYDTSTSIFLLMAIDWVLLSFYFCAFHLVWIYIWLSKDPRPPFLLRSTLSIVSDIWWRPPSARLPFCYSGRRLKATAIFKVADFFFFMSNARHDHGYGGRTAPLKQFNLIQSSSQLQLFAGYKCNNLLKLYSSNESVTRRDARKIAFE